MLNKTCLVAELPTWIFLTTIKQIHHEPEQKLTTNNISKSNYKDACAQYHMTVYSILYFPNLLYLLCNINQYQSISVPTVPTQQQQRSAPAPHNPWFRSRTAPASPVLSCPRAPAPGNIFDQRMVLKKQTKQTKSCSWRKQNQQTN